MLPSTGYFKGYSCPFNDSGLCERPYCHFRHVKRDLQSASDGIESGAILQKLVSAEVKKILQLTEASGSTTDSPGTNVEDKSATSNVPSNTKVIYNPTPISELNKINSQDSDNSEDVDQRRRHIPVPYTPRKPVGMPLRRPVETNGSTKPFIYNPPPVKYTPGSVENVQCDAYSPAGATESTEKYIPGSEKDLQEYTPSETNENSATKRNYIPSDKNETKKKILEYKPIKVTTANKLPSVTYQPTPRSLAPCFSSDEEEPDTKKRKLSSDLNGLDDLGPEFDILDQILDEEKQDNDSNSTDKTKKGKEKTSKISKEHKKSSEHKVESKTHSTKDNNKNSKADKKYSSKDEKRKSHKSDKSTSKDREKEEKSKHSEKKSSHKSSHKDRDKDKSKHRDKNEKDRHSDKSKSSSRSSDKHSKEISSKESRSSKSSSKNNHRKSHKSSKDSKEKHKSKSKNATSDNDMAADNICDIEDETYMSESDEETIALQCKKIFEEYIPTEKPKITEDTSQVEDQLEEEHLPGKKRIARASDKKVLRNPPTRLSQKISAAQVMTERLAKVKQYHNTKLELAPTNSDSPQKVDAVKSPFNVPSSGNSKIRIAHVPYASTLLNAKKSIPNQNLPRSEPSTSSSVSCTITQTVKKGSQRIAHIPNEKFIDRPGVLEPLSSKIPSNIRSTYLNMMIDECLKIYVSATDAYARAQHEELATNKKCCTVQIYKNSAVLTVSRLRKELQECNGVKKTGSDCLTLQRASTGNLKECGSWSIQSKNRKAIDKQDFTGPKFYKNIEKWILSEEELKQNGFPRPHPNGEKGRAIIYGQNKQQPPKGFIRTCCRCKKEYTVDKKGFPALKEECIYHPNNKYRVRGEARYQCCSQDGTSDGCCIAPNHVYEYVDYENLRGYVKTLPPDTPKDDYGVYSLDCEMCYTTHGLDLTRLTVIDSACKVVYETLIKPLHPIIDYNTRFSGITEEQMAEVKTTLLEVQATLLTMFSSKTILIGHSLESDFKALKLIHDTIIDTSVLFPHKMGPPFKRALRNLSSEYLKKIIQNSVEGHNSAEDATVCMELIHYKLKEDLKTR